MFSTDFGLGTLISNESNRIGTGASLAKAQADREVAQRYALNTADIMSRVSAAKSAGLHPLAALGVNVAGSSMMVGQSAEPPRFNFSTSEKDPNADLNRRLLAAQVKAAESDADETVRQNTASALRLAGQPGNPPLVELQPSKVIRTKPESPHTTEGINPTEDRYSMLDVYGHNQNVQMPSEKYGQVLENLGEVNSTILGLPYVLRGLYSQYLATPHQFLQDEAARVTHMREGYKFRVSPSTRRYIERR